MSGGRPRLAAMVGRSPHYRSRASWSRSIWPGRPRRSRGLPSDDRFMTGRPSGRQFAEIGGRILGRWRRPRPLLGGDGGNAGRRRPWHAPQLTTPRRLYSRIQPPEVRASQRVGSRPRMTGKVARREWSRNPQKTSRRTRMMIAQRARLTARWTARHQSGMAAFPFNIEYFAGPLAGT